MMSEPAQKGSNQAIIKLNYTLELFITLEMVYYCCFSLGGNLDFLDFLQKKFFNINYRGGTPIYAWTKGFTRI